MTEPVHTHMTMHMDDDDVTGSFSDFVRVWRTQDVFVLDFLAQLDPPAPATDPESGAQIIHLPTKLVSRLRVPPAQVMLLLKTLADQLAAHDAEAAARAASPVFPEDLQ